MRRVLGILAVLAAVTAVVPPMVATAGVGAGDCAWAVKADPDRVNVAFPDENAQYWAAQLVLAPGAEAVISGAFPLARYISFHAYEGSVPIDAVTDVDIVPASGSNLFLPGANRSAAGTYEVRVVGGPRPDPQDREANTLYAGEGLNGEPLAATTVLYRIYLPEKDVRGGVPLPDVEYRLADGDVRPLPSCDGMVPPGDGTVNEPVKQASVPVDAPSAYASSAQWNVARSRPQPNAVGPVTVNSGNAFFANFDNEYLSLLVAKSAGDVVAFRAKAPTFPDTVGAATMGSGELRYWSICSNDFPTTRYVACLADHDVVLDEAGWFTMVVSDPAHRPQNLRPTDNWLAAGPYADFFLLYRHMLPDPGFAHAIQRVPQGARPESTMGDYYPVPHICTRARFEADRCGIG